MEKEEIFNRINDLIKTCDTGMEDSKEYTGEFYKDKVALTELVRMYKNLEEIEKIHKEEAGRLEADLTCIYLNGIYDERNRWINKIKLEMKLLDNSDISYNILEKLLKEDNNGR